MLGYPDEESTANWGAECGEEDREGAAAGVSDGGQTLGVNRGLLACPGDPGKRFHDDEALDAQAAGERLDAIGVAHRLALALADIVGNEDHRAVPRDLSGHALVSIGEFTAFAVSTALDHERLGARWKVVGPVEQGTCRNAGPGSRLQKFDPAAVEGVRRVRPRL